MSLRSAALPLNGVGEAARPAALQKRRTQKKASAWNVLATGRGGGSGGRRRCCRAYSGSSSSESSAAAAAAGGAAGAKAVLRRDRISAAALTEKVIIRMLLGSTPWEARNSARCIIVNVLPVPRLRLRGSPFVASATRRCRSLRGAAGRGGAAAAAGAATSKRSSRRTSTSWPLSRGSSLGDLAQDTSAAVAAAAAAAPAAAAAARTAASTRLRLVAALDVMMMSRQRPREFVEAVGDISPCRYAYSLLVDVTNSSSTGRLRRLGAGGRLMARAPGEKWRMVGMRGWPLTFADASSPRPRIHGKLITQRVASL